MQEKVRVYVGSDRSQLLAVKVLEHSIKRHTNLEVEVYPMLDLPIRKPQDPRNWQRTGFSFSRFCIPQLAGYSGKAIYMDADMLVFQDIASLWNIPFDGAKVIIQADLPQQHRQTKNKKGAPKQRIKQCAVMLLDCGRLNWDIEEIIEDLDSQKYDYEQLMYDLCILNEDTDIKYDIPFEWNSLEYYDKDTCLIHYTDMATQPWVSCNNKYDYLWFNEVRLMLENSNLSLDDLNEEIRLKYFRKSLLRDLKYGKYIPFLLKPLFKQNLRALDKKAKYKPHREVSQLKKIRQQAVKDYEKSLPQEHRSASV